MGRFRVCWNRLFNVSHEPTDDLPCDTPLIVVLFVNVMENTSTEDLREQIVQSVHECWERHRMPLLLSRLGNQDDGKISRLAKEHGISLGHYLRRRLANRLQVIQHRSKPQLVGAVPVDVNVDDAGGVERLLERTQGDVADAVPRFLPAFWAAFRKPLDESQWRYISVREPVIFQDLPSSEKPPDFVEVDRRYVLGPDAEAAEITRTAQSWITDNELPEALYMQKTTSRGQSLRSDNLLDALLSALDPNDLGRVVIPLDVVLKLRTRSW